MYVALTMQIASFIMIAFNNCLPHFIKASEVLNKAHHRFNRFWKMIKETERFCIKYYSLPINYIINVLILE